MALSTHNSPRGYSCVGIWEPKNPANVGAVLRAAGCFGVDLIALQGTRYKHRHTFTDTQKAWLHIPMIETNDLRSILPRGCVGVAVGIVEDAIELPQYVHPERAFYIFGGEDRTLDQRILGWCRDKVVIPSRYCLNLGAAVNVVLYDRQAKALRASSAGQGLKSLNSVFMKTNSIKLFPAHEATADFHNHLDECEQCSEHPMNLCETGDRLIRACVVKPGFDPAKPGDKRTATIPVS